MLRGVCLWLVIVLRSTRPPKKSRFFFWRVWAGFLPLASYLISGTVLKSERQQPEFGLSGFAFNAKSKSVEFFCCLSLLDPRLEARGTASALARGRSKQCRLPQRGGSLAAHDARTPDHLYATMIHFQQRSQSPFQFHCLSLNQPNFSLSRCCAVLSYPRAACCPCRRRRSHSLPVPRGDLSLRPRATCTQARLYLKHTT